MAVQVQFRRGTKPQHDAFTGATAEVTINTTDITAHVHDGVTAGGFPLARADATNLDFTGLAGVTTFTSVAIHNGTVNNTTIGIGTSANGNFTNVNFVDGQVGSALSVGAATTFKEALVVNGDARVTGILTIGTGTIIIDGDNSTISGVDGGTFSDVTATTTDTQNLRAVAGVVTTLTSTNATITDLNVTADARVGSALTVTGNTDLNGNLTVQGNLDVQGTVTTIESTTVTIDDKNIELGSVDSPSDVTANGGGITLKGATDKTITWQSDTGGWEVNQDFLPSADGTHDLGASGQEWQDLWVDGTANIDSLVADTADINGGTIDGATIGGSSAAEGTFTNLTAADANITADARVGAALTVTGKATFQSNVYLGDNDGMYFGVNYDLQLYHDGSNSYVRDNGFGSLILAGDEIEVQNSSLNETKAVFTTNGAVELYYDNSKKFETTAYGIDVTGTTGTDGLAVSGVSTFTGQIDGNGGADISGGETTLSSATVSDLTNNRVVIAGTSGALEDDANFTYDGTDLSVNSAKITDLTSGRVVLAGTSGALEDSGNLTFNGTTLSAPTADLTNATIDNLTFTSGTAITSVDTDLSSVSASDDTLASAKAIKSYVDSQVTAQDLDIAGDSGTGAVDLDSQTFTIAGTSNEIETSVSGQTVTIGLPNDVTVSAAATIGGALTVSGDAKFQGNVDLGDNDRLRLGDGDDLQIYHDGSASYIGDFGTGTLQLISNGTGVFIAKSPFEYMGKFNTDGAVELYYDNSKKFETTAYGVDVTGTTGTDGLAVSGVSTFTGQIDGNGGANISGGESILSSATVSDLTSGRVVLAGTSGAIEDSANLTFNGTTLSAPTADLTNATIDNLTFTSGTAITSVDTDLSSVSGSDDTLASAKAIKTYVDAQITAQDLDFAGGTGTGAVDLDSQTLTIAGTTNEIETSASGQTLTIGLPDDVTILQDLTIGRDVLISRNLNVTGNVTIGGTSATIFASELKVADADIVLGIRTDESGNDISNDTTADHGGVAVASTEGTPLVSLFNPGIGESNPATYKKIMWFKTGSFSGLGTDAWLSNYAIGIGSTQVPNNVVLAAGAVNITNNDISYVRDVTIARNSTVGGTFGVTGTTTLTGALVANGNVDLGNATSDTITATGRFDSDLVPSTDNARDLGSSSLEWRNLYIDGTANIDSLVADTADINGGTIDGATIGGSSAAEGTFTNLTAQGNVDLGDATSDTITATGRFDSDLVPSTDSARDLGSTSLRWAQVWSDQVVADNIQIGVTGTNEIDTVSGNLTIDSAGGTTTIDDALSVTGNISGNLANTLTLNTSGTGLSGSQTYNNSGASTFTVTSNATSSNTGSTIVARDGSGNFNAGTITATLSGTATNATNITLADESADTTCFPVFATSATGNQAPKTGSNLTFNSANGTLSATTFSGSGTFTTVTASGDITANGNIVGDSSTNISGISSVTASTFFGDGSGLSNTGASLSAASGSQRVVLTSLTTGTMTSAATEAALAYNASTDTLTAGTFSGSGASLTSIPNGALDNSTISGVSLGSNLNTLTLNTSGTGLSGSQTYNGSGAATFTVTSNATSANTASAIVARDGSGNFSAGTITADLSGNADTATLATASTYITVDDESSDTTCFPVFTTAASGILSPKTGTNLAFNSSNGTLTATTFSGSGASLTSIPNGALTNSTISGVSLGSNLATLTRGSYLTGSNYNGSAGQTWAVDATSANTASKVVARDGSGNFSAGTITATLSGTASNANTLDSLDSSQFLRSDTADTKTSGDLTFNDNVKATFGTSGDLQIFHNGSNSYIDDAGTGNLYIRSGSTFIQGYGTGETCARFTENGSVDLYHNNSKKFETVTGGIQVTGTVTATSDIKLKENVTTIENGLDKVSQLRGVEFDFKSNGQHSLGVIAQEVEQVLPDLVTTNEEGIKSVAYGNLTAVLIEAVKELKAEVAELRARLDG